MKAICVYCGSNAGSRPAYAERAAALGERIAREGLALVYGGGNVGLMGLAADAALAAGGEVIGVIPDALVGTEVAHRGCTELHVVSGMHERKKMFTDLSDGFLTIPGGVGTMDELWEAISWAQLGYHDKPVGLLNVNGFYDQLVAFNRHMIEVGFIRPQHANILIVDDTLDGLLAKMAAYEPHQSIFSMTTDDL